MHLPQELVNEIVEQIDHGTDLETLFKLLQASTTVFSPQICLNLHRRPVHLRATSDYALLSSISALSADILPSLHILEISAEPYKLLLEPQEQCLPSLLDGCTGLQSLTIELTNSEWSFAYPEKHREALYRAMQRHTLVSLRLAWMKFGNNDLKELGGLTLPPSLKSITLTSVELVDEDNPLAQPVHLDGGAPGIEKLQTDAFSLPFARLMYRPPRPYPYGNLRNLFLNAYGETFESSDLGTSLLRANPHLVYLHLRGDEGSVPPYDLSMNTALRVLVIQFNPRVLFSIANIVNMLRTFPRQNGLEYVQILGIMNNAMIEDEAEHWKAMDDALASEERFPALLRVYLFLSQPGLRPSLAEGGALSSTSCVPRIESLMRKTRERGVLDLQVKFMSHTSH
ncbi:hypothetical protein BD626DRAFT_151722 [Schizophyllum amplum]|uniref:F-box domain-containing protein n=1 Tax=Schizophyllum amplum TaxID=97359 RepID=A0A550C499_9AGAR|nr:hypothetical protein BD626DRAFT_151722 [Auriculariopsis ampla]